MLSDGRLGDAVHRRHFGVAKTAQRNELETCALHWRKLFERAEGGSGVERGLRGAVGSWRGRFALTCAPPAQQSAAPQIPRSAITGQSTHDSEEPWREGPGGIERFCTAIDDRECVLNDILRFVPVAHELGGEERSGSDVPVDKARKGGMVPPQ
jgi:hypothetical protein